MDFQHATDILEFWTRLQELAEGIGPQTSALRAFRVLPLMPGGGPKALQNLYVSYSRIQGMPLICSLQVLLERTQCAHCPEL